MRIHVLTLFPEMFEGFLNTSIIKRAIGKEVVEIKLLGRERRRRPATHVERLDRRKCPRMPFREGGNLPRYQVQIFQLQPFGSRKRVKIAIIADFLAKRNMNIQAKHLF